MPTIDASILLAAAAAAAGHQSHPAATLYLVATPIGNLADITLRALHVLSLADTVACEDTRVTAPLLNHYGLHRPLLALHEHNEREAATRVVALLNAGQRVAYVSDAGTPCVSDPGGRLVDAVHAAGFRVMPIPGASSAMAALSAAGDPSGAGFVFQGFAAAKGAARAAQVQAWAAEPRTQLLFESPHRLPSLLDALAAAAPSRRVTIARELTKQFETIATMPAADLPGWLAADAPRARGEFVLVLHALPAPPVAAAEGAAPDAIRCMSVLMRELPLSRSVALAAEITGAPRKLLYEQALRMRGDAG